jgi:hypothetical protein
MSDLTPATLRRIMKIEFNKDYCKNCEMRFPSKQPPILLEKDKINCPAGRKNNPKSLMATVNVLKNKGQVCSFNPARKVFDINELKGM